MNCAPTSGCFFLYSSTKNPKPIFKLGYFRNRNYLHAKHSESVIDMFTVDSSFRRV